MRRKNHNGYIEVYLPGHPRARGNGYVFEHILVAEEKIGRPLMEDETVHHIDRNKENNDPSNLEVLTRSEHTKKYHQKPRRGVIKKCPICGTGFYVKPSHISKRVTCSFRCAGTLGNLVWEAMKNAQQDNSDRPADERPGITVHHNRQSSM